MYHNTHFKSVRASPGSLSYKIILPGVYAMSFHSDDICSTRRYQFPVKYFLGFIAAIATGHSDRTNAFIPSKCSIHREEINHFSYMNILIKALP